MSPFDNEFEKIKKNYNDYIATGNADDQISRIDYINKQYNSINLILKMIAVSSTGVPIESQVVTNEEATKKNAIRESLFRPTNNKERDTKIEKSDNIIDDDLNKEVESIGTEEPMVEIDSDTISSEDNTIEDIAEPINSEDTLSEENNSTEVESICDKLDMMTTEDLFKEELEAWGIKEDSHSYLCVITLAKVGAPGMDVKDAIRAVARALNSNAGIVTMSFNRLINSADFSKTKYNDILLKIPKEEITKEIVISELLDFCD